jgi:probable F420-dependent oxidoreductase
MTTFDGSTGRPRIGVLSDSTDYTMPILDFARALEERGFTGLFLNEHPHMPVETPRSPWPSGGPTPERYGHFWDPYIALSFVAATTGLEIGPTVSLVAEHDAIALAKAVATLDVLSGGRLVLGVGWGWNREEFEDHGLPANVRATVVEETVRLMRELWTHEEGSYEGVYRRVSRAWSYPKPVQRPHPPVLLGAPAGEKNFRRIASWADGWIPMGTPDFFGGGFERDVTGLREAWTRAGRDSAGPRLTAILFHAGWYDGGREAVASRRVVLPFDRWEAALDRAAELGVERVLIQVRDEEPSRTLRTLDELAAVLNPLYR